MAENIATNCRSDCENSETSGDCSNTVSAEDTNTEHAQPLYTE
jgi:hypothetical protein